MTTGTDTAGEATVTMPKKEFYSIVGSLTGVVALLGFVSFWAVIPERVTRLEIHDRDQDRVIETIQQDSAQRRELLAGAMATLAQINDRTKRIEDHLVSEHPPVK
jgi:uncharacterized coiled-coil protein SlyX